MSQRYISAYCPTCDRDLRAPETGAKRTEVAMKAGGSLVNFECLCGRTSSWVWEGSGQPKLFDYWTYSFPKGKAIALQNLKRVGNQVTGQKP